MSLITFAPIQDGVTGVNASATNTPLSTIYNDYNGNITDANISASAAIAATKISGLATNMLSNPYKFSVYRNSALTDGNGAFALMAFDSKNYDTSSNVDVVTNKGRFTAPIAGFYHFNAQIGAAVTSTSTTLLGLYKNGSDIYVLDQRNAGANNTVHNGGVDVQLAQGDYIEIFHWGTGGSVLVGVANNFFTGHLISAT